MEFGVHETNLRTAGKWGVLVLETFPREFEFDAGGGHALVMTQVLHPTNLRSNEDCSEVPSRKSRPNDKLPD